MVHTWHLALFERDRNVIFRSFGITHRSVCKTEKAEKDFRNWNGKPCDHSSLSVLMGMESEIAGKEKMKRR